MNLDYLMNARTLLCTENLICWGQAWEWHRSAAAIFACFSACRGTKVVQESSRTRAKVVKMVKVQRLMGYFSLLWSKLITNVLFTLTKSRKGKESAVVGLVSVSSPDAWSSSFVLQQQPSADAVIASARKGGGPWKIMRRYYLLNVRTWSLLVLFCLVPSATEKPLAKGITSVVLLPFHRWLYITAKKRRFCRHGKGYQDTKFHLNFNFMPQKKGKDFFGKNL